VSTSTLIIGESGSGKSTSLRNLKADECLLIQTIKKQLPFKNDWKPVGTDGGNIYVNDDYEKIKSAMEKTQKKIIIVDDFQYMVVNEYMRRAQERGYDKFTEMCQHVHSLIIHSTQLADDDKRVYFLSHSERTEDGRTKCKTIGRMLDSMVTLEGLFTIVLKASKEDDKHFFTTENSGFDTIKSPMGMFESNRIDNDLKVVDDAIKSYWNIQ